MQTPQQRALHRWNVAQPAWMPFKRYDQLTPAEQTTVDLLAKELESQ